MNQERVFAVQKQWFGLYEKPLNSKKTIRPVSFSQLVWRYKQHIPWKIRKD